MGFQDAHFGEDGQHENFHELNSKMGYKSHTSVFSILLGMLAIMMTNIIRILRRLLDMQMCPGYQGSSQS